LNLRSNMEMLYDQKVGKGHSRTAFQGLPLLFRRRKRHAPVALRRYAKL